MSYNLGMPSDADICSATPGQQSSDTQPPETPLSARSIVLMVLSLVVMGFVILMPTRFLPWFTAGFPIRFAPALLIVFSLAATLALLLSGGAPNGATMKARIVRSWPVIAMTVIDLAFLAHAFLGRGQPDLVATMRLRYWLFVGMSMLTLPASYYAGLLCRSLGDRRLGVFLAVVTGISFAVGLAEYLQLLGYRNLIAEWLAELNRIHATGLSMWKIQPGEPLRAQGLETYPALYAFPALITVSWALASKSSRRLRVSVLLFSLGIIALSGSRTVLVAALLIVTLWAASRVRELGLRVWLRRYGAALLLVLVVAVIAMPLVLSAPADMQGVVGRMADSVEDLEEAAGPDTTVTDVLGGVTNERTMVWENAFREIREHPLGTGFPYRFSVTAAPHAHSDLLERLVWGGPLMLGGFLVLLFWLMFCIETPSAPVFGVLAGVAILVTAMGEIVTMEWSLPAIALFIAGALAGERWLDGHGPFVSRFSTRTP